MLIGDIITENKLPKGVSLYRVTEVLSDGQVILTEKLTDFADVEAETGCHTRYSSNGYEHNKRTFVLTPICSICGSDKVTVAETLDGTGKVVCCHVCDEWTWL